MSLVAFGGVHPTLDRTGEYKAKTAASAGAILAETTTAGELDLASNKAAYVLEHDVVASPFVLSEFLLGVASMKTKTGELCDAIRIHPGMVIETDVFAAGTDTGALSATTAVGDELGVDSGKLRAKQTGDVVFAKVEENKISTDGTVVVRFVAVG